MYAQPYNKKNVAEITPNKKRAGTVTSFGILMN